MAAGDFNHDGKLDLAVAIFSQGPNGGSGAVEVLPGNGDGSFSGAANSPIPVGDFPVSVAVADFNRDGIPDLAAANGHGNTVSVVLGNGDGSFTLTLTSPAAGSSVSTSWTSMSPRPSSPG